MTSLHTNLRSLITLFLPLICWFFTVIFTSVQHRTAELESPTTAHLTPHGPHLSSSRRTPLLNHHPSNSSSHPSQCNARTIPVLRTQPISFNSSVPIRLPDRQPLSKAPPYNLHQLLNDAHNYLPRRKVYLSTHLKKHHLTVGSHPSTRVIFCHGTSPSSTQSTSFPPRYTNTTMPSAVHGISNPSGVIILEGQLLGSL